MTAGTFPLLDLAVDALPLQPAPVFRDELRERLLDGHRLITLWGRAQTDWVRLTAVLQDAGGELVLLATRVDAERGLHTLTRDFPALHIFEREVHEQHRVPFPDHPWLKPVRFQNAGPEAMDGYPFYALAGKEVHEVAVGPIHAGVIEPGSFRFLCEGETVHHLEVHLGYQHRGVERRLLQSDPRLLTPVVETIAGDSSVAHAWAHCAAVERLAGLAPDPTAEASRMLALELERVAMHLAGLSGMATDVGFLQGAATYGRLRTTAINASMRLCGSRFGRGWIRPGESRAVVDEPRAQAIREGLALLARDLATIDERFLGSWSVQHRLRGVGRLSTAQARELGLVGSVARACGVPVDQRQFGLGLMGELPLPLCVEEAGDCWARARIRIRELQRSLAWVEQLLQRHPTLPPVRRPVGPLAPGRLVVSLTEGWRGEVVHCLETDAEGQLAHYKVQDPSLRNWFGLALAVRGNDISDFPICNKSFDLSYCGSDL